jgi:drug/metabolite transporter (DMT)-like permease
VTAPTAPDRTDPPSAGLRQWLPGYLVLTVVWGSSFLFIKVGIQQLPPLYVSLGRVFAGALTLLVVLLASRARLPRDPRIWGHLLVVGAVGAAAPFTLFAYGEQRVSSALAGIWNAATPLVVLPVAGLVFRTERLTRAKVAGILLGFLGVLVVLGVWQGVGGVQLTGQLMCLGAACCYGVAIPYQRRFLSRPDISMIGVPAGQLIMAALVLLVTAPLVSGAPPALSSLGADVVGSVLALGVLGTGLAFLFNYRVIRYAGATTSASVTYLLPVVATALGVLLRGERLSWYQPVGALIVLCGVAVAQGMLRRPSRTRRPPVPAQPVPAAQRTPAQPVPARPVAAQDAAGPEVPNQGTSGPGLASRRLAS